MPGRCAARSGQWFSVQCAGGQLFDGGNTTDTEAEVVVADDGGAVDADGHAQAAGAAVPGATAQQPRSLVTRHFVFNPLPDIACHVMQTESIGWIAAHRRCLAIAVVVATLTAIRPPCGRFIAPRVKGLFTTPGRVFPFFIRGQAPALPRALRQPLHIGLGVMPIHIDYRPVLAAEPGVLGVLQVFGALATAGPDVVVVLPEGDIGLAHGAGVGQAHFVHRLGVFFMAGLARIHIAPRLAAHLKTAGWQ